MNMMRIVVGKGSCDAAAILRLSMALAGAAREMGLSVCANKASRSARSTSRYLTLRDQAGRQWLIRVSNHRMPRCSSHPVPHLDLVSLDGASGAHEASLFISSIASGVAAWFDSTEPTYRRDLKRRRKRR